jgi:hypothetical protein
MNKKESPLARFVRVLDTLDCDRWTPTGLMPPHSRAYCALRRYHDGPHRTAAGYTFSDAELAALRTKEGK